MESVSILEHKDVIMQAAKKLGIEHLSTDGWGASGLAESPAIDIPVRYTDRKRIPKLFKEEVERLADEGPLFNVFAIPFSRFRACTTKILENGEWVYECN